MSTMALAAAPARGAGTRQQFPDRTAADGGPGDSAFADMLSETAPAMAAMAAVPSGAAPAAASAPLTASAGGPATDEPLHAPRLAAVPHMAVPALPLQPALVTLVQPVLPLPAEGSVQAEGFAPQAPRESAIPVTAEPGGDALRAQTSGADLSAARTPAPGRFAELTPETDDSPPAAGPAPVLAPGASTAGPGQALTPVPAAVAITGPFGSNGSGGSGADSTAVPLGRPSASAVNAALRPDAPAPGPGLTLTAPPQPAAAQGAFASVAAPGELAAPAAWVALAVPGVTAMSGATAPGPSGFLSDPEPSALDRTVSRVPARAPAAAGATAMVVAPAPVPAATSGAAPDPGAVALAWPPPASPPPASPLAASPLAGARSAGAGGERGLGGQLTQPLFTLAAAGAGTHTMTMRVSPESLGSVTVQASIGPDGVRIELFAGNTARAALANILPELRQGLSAAGFSATLAVADVEVPPSAGQQALPPALHLPGGQGHSQQAQPGSGQPDTDPFGPGQQGPGTPGSGQQGPGQHGPGSSGAGNQGTSHHGADQARQDQPGPLVPLVDGDSGGLPAGGNPAAGLSVQPGHQPLDVLA